MSNLRAILRRINSVRSTMQITRTMEMVSTARIQSALSRAQEADPYKEAITRMISHVVSAGFDSSIPLLAAHAKKDAVLHILIASDRGLAGAFNILLEKKVERAIKKLEAHAKEAYLITCGRKPTEYFVYRGYQPSLSFVGISSTPNQDQAQRIASYVIDAYSSRKIDEVHIHYWHARNRVDQVPVSEILLPVPQEKLMMPNKPRSKEALVPIEHVQVSNFSFDPSAQEVLEYLMPAYIRTVIFHALLDSAAAEHGARRRAMKSATDNAKEVLAQLEHTYNKVRQSSITTELNEIIGGASALEEDN